MTNSNYIGRFAPSPSGPLHLGSLTCALASYFDAKANRGKWLVRMEDIDPPREQAGADQLILATLESHGLYADDEIRYQSRRTHAYQQALSYFAEHQLSYRCDCTRKRLNTLAGRYDAHCLTHPPSDATPCAVRVKTGLNNCHIHFEDGIQGPVNEDLQQRGDFIIHRKDGLFAYQLAVSVDDIDQNITHVVRGSDLLETTAKQIYLIQTLGGKAPYYSHIPVVASQPGHKLSKQNHAPAIDNTRPIQNITLACEALGIKGAPTTLSLSELLNWGVAHWDRANLSQQREVMLDSLCAPE